MDKKEYIKITVLIDKNDYVESVVNRVFFVGATVGEIEGGTFALQSGDEIVLVSGGHLSPN